MNLGKMTPGENDPHRPGAKLDHGKVRMSLVIGGFARALRAVGEVATFGAAKYTDNGWVHVPNGIERYTDALLRHFGKEAEGERVDPESGLEHAAHLAWNALARLELMLRCSYAPEKAPVQPTRDSAAPGLPLYPDLDRLMGEAHGSPMVVPPCGCDVCRGPVPTPVPTPATYTAGVNQ